MQPEIETLEANAINRVPCKVWFFISLYAMIIVLGNWFDLRVISFFGLVANAGTLIFAFTFFLANIITEVYGYKFARLAIWWGFFFNLFIFIYGQLVILIPCPENTYNQMFDTLLQANNRAILAGLVSYFSSEPLNSLVMAKLKIELKGRYTGARFLIATIIGSTVDSVLFGLIAFYGVFEIKLLVSMIFGMTIIKVAIDFATLPFFLHLTQKLKQKEKLDIYDKGTRFNMFSFDTSYPAVANHFK